MSTQALTHILSILSLAAAVHSVHLLRASVVPLVFAVLSAVPLLVISAYAIAGSPSTIKGANGEGSLIPGAKAKLLAVWLGLNAPVQLLSVAWAQHAAA